MKKRLFITAAAMLIIAACMMPAIVCAESYVAEVNGNKYTDYKKAWDAVQNGGTIEMLSDWKLSERLEVTKEAKITIKMNGHTIDRGLITTDDKGKEKHKRNKRGNVISVQEGATLNLYDGTITGGCNNNGAGGIHQYKNTRVELYNVKVKGNAAEQAWYEWGDGDGGGFVLDGEKAYLYMYNSHITNNTVENSGGGVYISDEKSCTVELDGNSTIADNAARTDMGGGIYINGRHAAIFGYLDKNGQPTSKISGNTALDDGGAIYANGEQCHIKNLEISGNVVENCGGGIHAFAKDGIIEDCVIKNNQATNERGSYGGGVYVDNDGWKIKDSVITNNKGQLRGGGVCVNMFEDVDLEGNVIIKDNSSKWAEKDNLCLLSDGIFGTTAYIVDPSKLTSEKGSIGITSEAPEADKRLSKEKVDCDISIFFSDNSEYDIYWNHDVNTEGADYFLKLCKASDVKPEREVAATINGKEVYSWVMLQRMLKEVNEKATVELYRDLNTDDTIKIAKNTDVTLKMNGHTIDRGLAKKKEAKGNGTVLSVGKNATFNIYDGTLTGGCSDSYSSGIHIKEKARVNLYNVNVKGNRSKKDSIDGNGGGVMLDGEKAYLYMYDSHINSNFAERNGGGVYISDYKNCTVELDGNSSVSNNKAEDGRGGGIYINGQHATILGHLDEDGQPTSEINGNTATDNGGAIYVNSEHALIKDVEISGNSTDIDGGGIFADNEDGTIEGCVIKNNKTKLSKSRRKKEDPREGGGVHVDSEGWKIKDCTVTGNKASDYGGGIFVPKDEDIKLEGKMVVKDNTTTINGNDNLYLNSDGLTTSAYIVDPSQLTEGSKIGVTVGNFDNGRKVSANSGEFNQSYFFSDDSDKCVHWNYSNETGKGDKKLIISYLCDARFDTPVAEVNGEGKYSYDDAWNAVKNGGTIELFTDWKTDDTLKVSEKANVTLKMNGHTIDRGLAQKRDAKSNGTVLSVGQNATFNIYDGIITGGCSSSHSSGIHINEKARVNLYNVKVTENRSEVFISNDGNGGGVMLDGKESYLYLYDSHIDNNSAEQNGGGIYISNVADCTVELDGKSTVSNNYTGKGRDTAEGTYGVGGGIYINGKNAKIIGHLDENGQPISEISGNASDRDGGGINAVNENFLIKDLKISGNISARRGGGIYAGNKKGSIEDCTITGNKARDYGGGVCVCYFNGVDVDLEGNVVIKDNTADGKSDDLHLDIDGKPAYIKDPAKITSGEGSIGIKSAGPKDKRRLSADSGDFDASIFFSNDEKYVVAWDYDEATKKGDKLLKLREVSKLETEKAASKGQAELTETTKPAVTTEPEEMPETGSSEESIGNEYSFEITCGCGEVITGDELKEMLKEAELNSREVIEQNGGEIPKQEDAEKLVQGNDENTKNYIAYLLEDGETQIGSLEERLSDVILIKCPECEEKIEIDVSEDSEAHEFINALLEEINSESDASEDAASENSELAGMMLGSGAIYAIIAVIIAAAGSYVVIRRRKDKVS